MIDDADANDEEEAEDGDEEGCMDELLVTAAAAAAAADDADADADATTADSTEEGDENDDDDDKEVESAEYAEVAVAVAVAGAGTMVGFVPSNTAVPTMPTKAESKKPALERSIRYHRTGFTSDNVSDTCRVDCHGSFRWWLGGVLFS